MRKSDKAFIYVSLGGIKGISSRRELNVFASQSQQFDLFLIGLLDLLSHSCLNSVKASTGRDAPPGRYAPCVTVTGEERPLQRPGVASTVDRAQRRRVRGRTRGFAQPCIDHHPHYRGSWGCDIVIEPQRAPYGLGAVPSVRGG